MTVLSIESCYQDGTHVRVNAIVDNVYTRYAATYLEPAEEWPALCSASFELSEEESLPSDEASLCRYLSDLGLDWRLVDSSDNYL